MVKVAVTGSVGSGKSAVCSFFEKLEVPVLSADAIVHRLLVHSAPIKEQVVHLLGEEVLVKGELNREKIAKIVFSNPSLLLALERLIHPKVERYIDIEYAKRADKKGPFVVEVPLLFEGHMEKGFDIIIGVISKAAASQYKGTDYALRRKRQISDEELRSRADYIIENNGSLEELEQSTHNLFTHLWKNQ